MQVSSPRVHLHLLGILFRLCKPHPTSVWLRPLCSVLGRHHRYCWSSHCTAKQFQILSVGIEKRIDIWVSRVIMQIMNILIISEHAIYTAPSSGLVLGSFVWLGSGNSLIMKRKNKMYVFNSITPHNKSKDRKVQETICANFWTLKCLKGMSSMIEFLPQIESFCSLIFTLVIICTYQLKWKWRKKHFPSQNVDISYQR